MMFLIENICRWNKDTCWLWGIDLKFIINFDWGILLWNNQSISSKILFLILFISEVRINSKIWKIIILKILRLMISIFLNFLWIFTEQLIILNCILNPWWIWFLIYIRRSLDATLNSFLKIFLNFWRSRIFWFLIKKITRNI